MVTMASKQPPTLLLTLALLQLVSSNAAQQADAGLHPIVLVPGYANSELYARVTEEYRPSDPHCATLKDKGWFRLYVNDTWLRDPRNVPCFAEMMSEVYDPVNDDYRNIAGVEVRAAYFGSTRSLLYGDPDHKAEYVHMANFVKRLEDIGYKDGKSLFGAPYDFRYGPARPPHRAEVGNGFIRRLVELVEKASRLNGGKPVILVSHSFGCQLVYFLLINQPPSWLRAYVKHFIPLAGPWAGGVAGMMSIASGFNLGLPFISPSALKQQPRSIQATLWTFPLAKAFGDAPLVITKNKNYSSLDLVDFLHDVGLPQAIKPYLTLVKNLFPGLPAPGVPVTHIHGTGIQTIAQLLYTNKGGLGGAANFTYGIGDGVVDHRSAAAIDDWSRVPGQYLKVIQIPNTTHMGMLIDDMPLKIIAGEVLAANT